jgi:hypothetical protein
MVPLKGQRRERMREGERGVMEGCGIIEEGM